MFANGISARMMGIANIRPFAGPPIFLEDFSLPNSYCKRQSYHGPCVLIPPWLTVHRLGTWPKGNKSIG